MIAWAGWEVMARNKDASIEVGSEGIKVELKSKRDSQNASGSARAHSSDEEGLLALHQGPRPEQEEALLNLKRSC